VNAFVSEAKQDEGLGRKLHLLKEEGKESEWQDTMAPFAGCAGARA
jgi:hypothetical protein